MEWKRINEGVKLEGGIEWGKMGLWRVRGGRDERENSRETWVRAFPS